MKISINVKRGLFFLLLALFIILPIRSTSFIFLITVGLFLINIKYSSISLIHNKMMCFFIIFTLFATYLITLFYKGQIAISSTSFETYSINIFQQNTRYFIYITLALLIAWYVNNILSNENYDLFYKMLERILIVFVLLYFLFYMINIIKPDIYSLLRNLFYAGDIDLSSYEALKNVDYFSRYNFIFLDTNNCGYCMSGISIFLLENTKKKNIKLLSIILLIAIPIMTQSRGSFMVVLIYSFCKYAIKVKNVYNNTYKIKPINIIVNLVMITIVIILLLDICNDNYILNSLFSMKDSLFFRIKDGDDSRINIWKEVIEQLGVPPLIGSGYSLVNNDVYLKPHSDHLRLLYGYGIIFYSSTVFILMKLVKFEKKFLFMISFFLAATLNSVLDEYRVLFIFIILFVFTIKSNKGEVK